MVNGGVCTNCKRLNTGYAWCNKCDPGRFVREGKTSGNVEMDEFICERQQQTLHYCDNLEWIPYDCFKEVIPIGEGGFSEIYSATWLEGAPKYDKKKARTCPIKVALKKPKNLNITAFINEVRMHNECNYANLHITQLYGITKNPDTEEFMMVLEYATHGSLRDYLKNKYTELKWKDKLEILINIIDNLEFIHDRNYIHKDLHSGNILQFYYNDLIDTKITDLGLAQQQFDNLKHDSSLVCGVLPYMAPEILNGKPYTFASDVYSFGIIMVEVSTGKPPYGNVPHDEKLALAICNGLRPKVAKGTLKCYIHFLNQCLDANPEKRPTSKEILQKIRNWRFHDDCTHSKELFPKKLSTHSRNDIAHQLRIKFCLRGVDMDFQVKESVPNGENVKMFKEFIDADEDNDKDKNESSVETMFHLGAIYTSRLMNFNNLCEPRNSIGIQIEDSEFSDLINELVAQLNNSIKIKT
ncbi:hypothetical protein RclHR1_00370024 [Rhizophagus clarus]|nr:hypothetical protein RclHR1_00370024 [Rhizophagus clarus]